MNFDFEISIANCIFPILLYISTSLAQTTGISKLIFCNLRYQLYEMNFKFEISTVDYI